MSSSKIKIFTSSMWSHIWRFHYTVKSISMFMN